MSRNSTSSRADVAVFLFIGAMLFFVGVYWLACSALLFGGGLWVLKVRGWYIPSVASWCLVIGVLAGVALQFIVL